MRKWTYLVAALLVGGATTTFTGCIDNDEPAGIEQLRGAKAEFIKAKAAYESALTEIQLVKDMLRLEFHLDFVEFEAISSAKILNRLKHQSQLYQEQQTQQPYPEKLAIQLGTQR